jgi:6-phosphogluconate dehydrogenase (decarboxylating)
MSRIKILGNGHFVGLTRNTIQYGVIRLEQKAQLNCKI